MYRLYLDCTVAVLLDTARREYVSLVGSTPDAILTLGMLMQ